jgi:hypothetical protein
VNKSEIAKEQKLLAEDLKEEGWIEFDDRLFFKLTFTPTYRDKHLASGIHLCEDGRLITGALVSESDFYLKCLGCYKKIPPEVRSRVEIIEKLLV